MELPELAFERYEYLEGTWTPMEAVEENHFVDTVRHTVYSSDIYGYTTQVLKTIRLAVPRVHHDLPRSLRSHLTLQREERSQMTWRRRRRRTLRRFPRRILSS